MRNTKNNKIQLSAIFRKALTTSLLIPTTISILLTSSIYFIFQNYVSNVFQDTLHKKITEQIINQSADKADIISARLESIKNQTLFIQHYFQLFFKHQNMYPVPNGEPQFATHQNGAIYKVNNNGGASLYYSQTTKITAEKIIKARQTEAFDVALKAAVDKNSLVAQAYFNSWDNMSRIYPFIDDIPSLYGPTIDIEKYNFYFLAKMKHNPNRSVVWTSAYLDPARQGWVISCIAPVYHGDFLEGVVGVDITLEALASNILTGGDQGASGLVLIDEKGTIISMNNKAESYLGISDLHEHDYKNTINETIKKPALYSLVTNTHNKILQAMQQLLEKKYNLIETADGSYHYFISTSAIPNTDWSLFSINDSNFTFKQKDDLLFITDIILTISFICLFIIVIAEKLIIGRRFNITLTRISNPIILLATITKNLGKKNNYSKIQESGIYEIDKLIENFNNMQNELSERTARLIKEETEKIKIKKENKKLHVQSNIDPLTQLYNRRMIDKSLLKEWARVKRYHQHCSFIILDIDFFKKVNDKFGHLTGDKVLQEFSALIKKEIRQSDIASRWGGEEFFIICPNTSIKGAAMLAEKIRISISEFSFSTNLSQTASFGVGSIDDQSASLEVILEGIDKALYMSKSRGRNCVSVAE